MQILRLVGRNLLGGWGHVLKTDITEIGFRGLFRIGPNVEIL
jgi:hypothetical protein